ncbi:hypothetical protein HMPREF9720_0139 [Alistipes sp. HGB5]|nr:hypothetical protein HMPREF9720_0139 [Alistipes sp. HGB5]
MPKHLPRRSIHHRNGNSRTIIRRGHNTMRSYPVRARSICKSPQNASRGNARLRNESPPKRRGHNTMRPYPVRARIICKSPQNASRGNACLQNESPQNAHTLQSKRRCFSASPFS